MPSMIPQAKASGGGAQWDLGSSPLASPLILSQGKQEPGAISQLCCAEVLSRKISLSLSNLASRSRGSACEVCVGHEAEVDHAAATSNPLSSMPPDRIILILIWVLIDFSSICEICGRSYLNLAEKLAQKTSPAGCTRGIGKLSAFKTKGNLIILPST
jgi:hypothetical protein